MLDCSLCPQLILCALLDQWLALLFHPQRLYPSSPPGTRRVEWFSNQQIMALEMVLLDFRRPTWSSHLILELPPGDESVLEAAKERTCAWMCVVLTLFPWTVCLPVSRGFMEPVLCPVGSLWSTLREHSVRAGPPGSAVLSGASSAHSAVLLPVCHEKASICLCDPRGNRRSKGRGTLTTHEPFRGEVGARLFLSASLCACFLLVLWCLTSESPRRL